MRKLKSKESLKRTRACDTVRLSLFACNTQVPPFPLFLSFSFLFPSLPPNSCLLLFLCVSSFYSGAYWSLRVASVLSILRVSVGSSTFLTKVVPHHYWPRSPLVSSHHLRVKFSTMAKKEVSDNVAYNHHTMLCEFYIVTTQRVRLV